MLLKFTAPTPAAVPPRLFRKTPPEVEFVALTVEAITSMESLTPVAPMPVAAEKLTVPPVTSFVAAASVSVIFPTEVMFTVPVPALMIPNWILPLVTVVRSIWLLVPVATSVAIRLPLVTSISIVPFAASTSVNVVSVAPVSTRLPAVLACTLLKFTAPTPAAVPPRLSINTPPAVVLVALTVEAIVSK